MTVMRAVLGAFGLAAIAFGVWSLRELEFGQLLSTGIWLAAGPVIHDGLFAPLVIGLLIVTARVLPPAARRPAGIALVVWGTVTIMAIPVLSGMGGKPGNPTLLDLPYWRNWLLATAVVLLMVLLWSLWRAKHAHAADPSTGANSGDSGR